MGDRQTADDIQKMYDYQDSHGGNVRFKFHGWFGGHCNVGALRGAGVPKYRQDKVNNAILRYGGATTVDANGLPEALDVVGINDVLGKKGNREVGQKVIRKLGGTSSSGPGRRKGVSPQDAEKQRKEQEKQRKQQQQAKQRPGATPTKRRGKKRQESRPEGCCIVEEPGPKAAKDTTRLPVGTALVVLALLGTLVSFVDSIVAALVVAGIVALCVAGAVLLGAAGYVTHVTLRDWLNWDHIPVWRANRRARNQARALARETTAPAAAIAVSSAGVAQLPAAASGLSATEDADLKMAWTHGLSVADYQVKEKITR